MSLLRDPASVTKLESNAGQIPGTNHRPPHVHAHLYTVKTCTYTDHKCIQKGNGGRKMANFRTMDENCEMSLEYLLALQCKVLQRMAWP